MDNLNLQISDVENSKNSLSEEQKQILNSQVYHVTAEGEKVENDLSFYNTAEGREVLFFDSDYLTNCSKAFDTLPAQLAKIVKESYLDHKSFEKKIRDKYKDYPDDFKKDDLVRVQLMGRQYGGTERIVCKLNNHKANFYSYTKLRRDKKEGRVGRKVKVTVQGELLERTEEEIKRSLNSSVNRTIRTFLEYALANKWKYMANFTFRDVKDEEGKVNKKAAAYVREEALKKLKNFMTKQREKDKNFKLLAVIEKGKNNTKRYHFHALLNEVPEELLGNFTEEEFKKLPTKLKKYGRERLFYMPYWQKNYGFSSLIKLKGEDNNMKAVNYLIKYLVKDLIDLRRNEENKNKKAYFKTHGLLKATKFLLPASALTYLRVVKELDWTVQILEPRNSFRLFDELKDRARREFKQLSQEELDQEEEVDLNDIF